MKYLLALILLLSLSFAAIVQSGDAGKQFANDTATAKCGGPNVAAVYICNGNVVRVVSSLPGAGSTFYKPDGKVVTCPVVAPTMMGAECVQLMLPNFCPQTEVCGESNVTTIFPGNNNQTPVVPPEPEKNETNESAQNQTSGGQNETVDNETSNNVPPDNGNEVPPTTPVVKTGTENPFDFLLPVVVLLGVAAVIILFLMFKNSVHHDV